MFENPKTLNHFQQGDRGHLSKLIETVVSLTNYTVGKLSGFGYVLIIVSHYGTRFLINKDQGNNCYNSW